MRRVVEDRAPVLAVVCDVGPTAGVGHVMRCLALSEEFAARGHRIVFLADVTTVPFAEQQLAAHGFEHHRRPGDVEGILTALAHLAADVVVIDSYHLPLGLYLRAREQHRTLAMVDGDPQGRTADVVLDQNIGAELDDWDYGDTGVVLGGLDHALIRDAVLAHRPEDPRRHEADPLRVFAFFGGTDAFGAGPRVARELVATGRPFDLTVVSTRAWPDDVQAGAGQAVRVIGATDDLASYVRAADVVVSAAGTSTWELLCLGAAVGLVCVADNQALSYGRTVEAGLAAGVGTLADLATTAGPALDRLLDDGEWRAELRRRGHAAVDGRGRQRVADAVGGPAGRDDAAVPADE